MCWFELPQQKSMISNFGYVRSPKCNHGSEYGILINTKVDQPETTTYRALQIPHEAKWRNSQTQPRNTRLSIAPNTQHLNEHFLRAQLKRFSARGAAEYSLQASTSVVIQKIEQKGTKRQHLKEGPVSGKMRCI